MTSSKIFQLYFDQSQLARLDPAFIPIDNSLAKDNRLYEFEKIYSIFKEGIYKSADFVGVVSYKFGSKTKITGHQFLSFIDKNPGYDCYFINPFPHLAYLSYNVWSQAEIFHPGISEIAGRVLSELDLVNGLNDVPRHNQRNLCYCNFWVGSGKFWYAYGDVLSKLSAVIACATNERDSGLFKRTSHITPAPFFPFIFERLFSTFISLRQDLRCLAYSHTENEIMDACNYQHERTAIREIKSIVDACDIGGSFDGNHKMALDFFAKTVLFYTKEKMHGGDIPYCLL